MASLPNTKLVTYEEWLEMPEVKDEEAAAKRPHARIIAKLNASIIQQIDLSRFDALTGSFAIVNRLAPLTCRTPDLAAEVLSPRNTPRYMRQKIEDNASLGILSQGILKPTRFPHVQIDIASIWPD
jgi:Uma2 family endonuclease